MAEIIYSSTRVSYLPMILAKPLNINKKRLNLLFLHLCSCSKSREWEYEREIRLFLEQRKHLRQRGSISLYGDVRKALNGIILGINYQSNTEELKRLIDSTIKQNASNLQIVQATQSNKEFLVETGDYKDATPNDYKSWFNGFETTDAVNLYKDILKLGIHFQQRFLTNLFNQYGYNIDFPLEFIQAELDDIMKKDEVK